MHRKFPHRVTACRAESNYILWLRFEDGVEGRVYLGELVGAGVFKAWKDVGRFKQVSIDPVNETVSWDDGIELDPEVLYQDLANKRKRTMMH